MTLPSRLQADCAQCCGLCCVAPAFDAEQGFGFDKPAHTACPNLTADHRCGIHHVLREHGFPACATFDCFGAGQRVTQLFGEISWRTSPEIAASMFRLYSRYRALHELLALLELALQRMPPTRSGVLEECRRNIDEVCQVAADPERLIDLGALRKDVQTLIRHALRARLRTR